MALYEKLLLSAGGGIVSGKQQAEQARNTATILIGIGGTGIDCLRTIKTQVYSRLKPDDSRAIIPRYEHIRFLGIDTDNEKLVTRSSNEAEHKRSNELVYLEDTETFKIGTADIRGAINNSASLNDRRDLQWLESRRISTPNLGTCLLYTSSLTTKWLLIMVI